MFYKEEKLVFSPSDLTTFVESEFASWMDRFSKEFPDDALDQDQPDDLLELLKNKGDVHEKSILASMYAKGLVIADLSACKDGEADTLQAMQDGVDVIFQAYLKKGDFAGYADFLVKVEGESTLGDYHYEVWDTKLSKTTKPYFVIQLCCYQEMLQESQGVISKDIVVVLGNGKKQRLRSDNYYFYYLAVKEAFLELHNNFDKDAKPKPYQSRSWGNWSEHADSLLRQEDHLSLVANISRSQVIRLQEAGIFTVSDLSKLDKPAISGLRSETLQRLVLQAKLQKESERKDKPMFKVLEHNPEKKEGLALLPPHSSMDVFFDIEGYPLEEGGLEYLWGNTYLDEQNRPQFRDFWAHDAKQEKLAFEDFIHWVYERWTKDSRMHIYHYANYEIAACKKLMGRYGSCEYEVDQLLRNEVFVDLYKIVKGGLIIGTENYSIKSVERIYRDKRDTAVGTGGDSVAVYEQWRNNPDGDTWQTSNILDDIRKYNKDDCDSTYELVCWLRENQQQNNISFIGKTEVVEPDVPEEVNERTQLRDKFLKKADSIRQSSGEDTNSVAALDENLAWMLEFHRREAKPVFWKLFERLGENADELETDIECLANCKRTNKPGYKQSSRKKNICFEYQFNPHQEFNAVNTDTFYLLGEENEEGKSKKVSLVKELSDLAKGKLVVEAAMEPAPEISMIPDSYVNPRPIPDAIYAVIAGIDEEPEGKLAILDFLERKEPDISGHNRGEHIVHSGDALADVISAVERLKNSYLPIQGPPGAGKTYLGKQIITHLLRQGKKIGICSNSHKAINNLLIGTVAHCKKNGVNGFFACSRDTDEEIEKLGISVLPNAKLAGCLDKPCVIGTTAWGFTREDFSGKFDYLFIDEAGQVSVANLIGMSRAATNLVIMGDQMQLGQPAQGSHPAESGLSILDYLLRDQPIMPPDQGVFLDKTYRMHSSVNKFISDAFYDGHLESDTDNDKQVVEVPAAYQGDLMKQSGIVFVPVKHEGCTQASEEEVDVIKKLANEMIGRNFTDKNGTSRKISWSDMLFVAPYNHQVNKLKEALGDEARVGSVDKFQGQEAPVVFLSMCASDANEHPRGIDFLFDKKRLNVAISRAQSLAVVVGNPRLRYTSATSVKHQELINIFCRLTYYAKGD